MAYEPQYQEDFNALAKEKERLASRAGTPQERDALKSEAAGLKAKGASKPKWSDVLRRGKK